MSLCECSDATAARSARHLCLLLPTTARCSAPPRRHAQRPPSLATALPMRRLQREGRAQHAESSSSLVQHHYTVPIRGIGRWRRRRRSRDLISRAGAASSTSTWHPLLFRYFPLLSRYSAVRPGGRRFCHYVFMCFAPSFLPFLAVCVTRIRESTHGRKDTPP